MLNIKIIKNHKQTIIDLLKKRKYDTAQIDVLLEKDSERIELQQKIDNLRAERKKNSKQIGKLKQKDGREFKNLQEKVKKINDLISEQERSFKNVSGEIMEIGLNIPNLPHHSVLVGTDESSNKILGEFGKIQKKDFKILTHDELGEKLDLLDLKKAANMSGSRFAILKEEFAVLERALISFMLDIATKENGYIELNTPFLVNEDTCTGTAQIPHLQNELYHLKRDNLYLIPTGEVPLVFYHSNEIIEKTRLPLKLVACTACFRREAGSYGKDVKGIMRVHQFNKVELVKITSPEDSYKELESLLNDAEKILQLLELPYRKVELCTGDLAFQSAKTYDLEVWIPSQNRYREISSCSNCEDFQARRLNIKYRDQNRITGYVHTLNGSALAAGRTLIAIVENFQQKDCSIAVPDILRPYTKFDKIKK